MLMLVTFRAIAWLMVTLVTAVVCGDGPVKIIFDTDMAGDCDDTGALAVLHGLANLGEAEILAITTNSKEASGSSAAACDVINTFYGRGQIPIGTDKDGKKWWWKNRPSPFASVLRDRFEHDALPDDQMPDAIDVYRQTLASQPDDSVVVCSVGALSNLEDLLRSGPDQYSPLGGQHLVDAKVSRLVVMGGGFPRTSAAETNLHLDVTAATYVATQWPTLTIWSGFEIGAAIINGTELQSFDETHPVRVAYQCRPFRGKSSLDVGKPSHDHAAVLIAVRGLEEDLWSAKTGGQVIIDSVGHSRWEPLVGNRQHWWPNHQYVILRGHSSRHTAVIGQLMATGRPADVEN